MSKLDADSSSRNVTRSDNATCFIVPLSLAINLSAAASVVEVAAVPPSIKFISAVVAVTPSRIFNSAVVTVAPSIIATSVAVNKANAVAAPD